MIALQRVLFIKLFFVQYRVKSKETPNLSIFSDSEKMVLELVASLAKSDGGGKNYSNYLTRKRRTKRVSLWLSLVMNFPST